MAEENTFMTYGPAERLFQAAAAIERCLDRGLAEAPDKETAELKAALEECRNAIGERTAYAQEIEKAREEFANDELEIDDDPVTSVSDEGVWVSAWVWVPHSGPKLEGIQAVWRSEDTIAITFAPIPEDGYDESQVISSCEAFLDDKAKFKELIMDEAGQNYVGALIAGLRISELDKLGVPVLDGRDS